MIKREILTLKRVVALEIQLLKQKEESIPKCHNRKAYLIRMEIIVKLFKKLKEKVSPNIFTIDQITTLYRISLKRSFKV